MIKTLAEQRVFAYSIAIIYNVLWHIKRTKKNICSNNKYGDSNNIRNSYSKNNMVYKFWK